MSQIHELKLIWPVNAWSSGWPYKPVWPSSIISLSQTSFTWFTLLTPASTWCTPALTLFNGYRGLAFSPDGSRRITSCNTDTIETNISRTQGYSRTFMRRRDIQTSSGETPAFILTFCCLMIECVCVCVFLNTGSIFKALIVARQQRQDGNVLYLSWTLQINHFCSGSLSKRIIWSKCAVLILKKRRKM